MGNKTKAMSEETWYRHANPWSGWSRILTYPLLYIPLWYMSYFVTDPAGYWYVLLSLILIGIWYWVNPRIFPKPDNYDSWISKGVLGEKLWLENGKKDVNFVFTVVVGALSIPALIFTYLQMFWPMMFFAGVAILVKMWFLEQMVSYYENHKEKPVIS